MKERRFRRLVAVVLSVAMVMASSVMVMADDSQSATLSGNGIWEGHMDKEVFNVTLPTAAADVFDFKFDPEKLISQTNGARYNTLSFDSAPKTVYFYNDESKLWTDKSSTVSANNKSSVSVDLTAVVTITSANGINFVSSNSFDGEGKDLYLALVDKDDSDKAYPVAKSGEAITVTYTKTVEQMPADKYSASWNGTAGKYEYVLSSDAVPGAAQIVDLYMTGAANEDADWSDNTANPEVEVVWTMAKHSDTPAPAADKAPSIAQSTYTYTAGQAVVVPVDLGTGSKAATGITKITFTNNGAQTDLPTTRYSYANGKITFTAEYTTKFTGSRTHTVTFNDSAATTATFTLAP